MNLDRELIFSYVEEDNIQRAYFRVHPLLTPQGMVAEEALQRWPCEGCLRIVPDRAEQHTFKERMRQLGGWCVVDLTAFAPEANKIRTNKNFHPDRGEVNQYILYSDAVLSVLDHVFYEVLEGTADDAAALAARAITPRFYIRQDDTLYGPVKRAEPVKPETAEAAEAVLYSFTAPDGVAHQILCVTAEAEEHAKNAAAAVKPVRAEIARPLPETAPKPAAAPVQPVAAPAPVEAKPVPVAAPVAKEPVPAVEPKPADAEAALPIGQALNILDQNRTFEETLNGLNQPVSSGANLLKQEHTRVQPQDEPAPKLSGTPLFRTPMRTSTPQPKNRTQEVVSNQWRVIRNDPPAEPLPAGATMRQVDNPVENACQALRRAWGVSAAHNQLVDCILSLDGMAAKLEPRASKGVADSALYHAIQRRLQDLEAERLTALVQLDKAKADLEAFRKQAIETAAEKTRAELVGLEKDKEALEGSNKTLREQIAMLTTQRDELASRIDEMQRGAVPEAISKMLADSAMAIPAPGVALRLSPVSGEKTSLDDMLARVQAMYTKCGLPYSRNRAIALLVAMTVSDRVSIVSAAPAAAATMGRSLASYMGWNGSFVHQVSLDQRIRLAAEPVDATPAVLMTAMSTYAPVPGVRKLLLTRNAAQTAHNATYECDQWPMLPSDINRFVAEAACENATPVSFASMQALLNESGATDQEIDQMMMPMLELVPPLSGKAMNELRQFVSACAHWMDGGLSSAIDWAVMMWIMPALEHTPKNVQAMQELLNAYPLSQAMLQ